MLVNEMINCKEIKSDSMEQRETYFYQSYFGERLEKQFYFVGLLRVLHKPQGLKINTDFCILLKRLMLLEEATILVIISAMYITDKKVLERVASEYSWSSKLIQFFLKTLIKQWVQVMHLTWKKI